ncbi:MAG: hypothetical protein LBD09_05220 [Treponema sp.]|jgi:hypothetical protein|nr:hypothetical protein [Treponema sp.]
MLSSFHAGKPLPKEYRQAAEVLFPPGPAALDPAAPAAEDPADRAPAALAFADCLGVAADYRRLDSGWRQKPRSGESEKFLLSFRNNLELLIQKTWVEKADEDRKEKLLDRIPGFIGLITRNDYAGALAEFGAILEELAWLLFGPQSRKEDFFEYVFRIDHQMGLFWWYGGQLGRFLAAGPRTEEALRAVLFLGICYLADF